MLWNSGGLHIGSAIEGLQFESHYHLKKKILCGMKIFCVFGPLTEKHSLVSNLHLPTHHHSIIIK